MIYTHFEQKNAIVTMDQQDDHTCTIVVRKEDGTLLLNAAIGQKATTVNVSGGWETIK